MNLFAEFDENYPNLVLLKLCKRYANGDRDSSRTNGTNGDRDSSRSNGDRDRKKTIIFLKNFRFFTFKTILII